MRLACSACLRYSSELLTSVLKRSCRRPFPGFKPVMLKLCFRVLEGRGVSVGRSAGRVGDTCGDRPEPCLLGAARRVHLIDSADLLAILEDAIILEVLERGRRADVSRTEGQREHGGLLERDKHPRNIGLGAWGSGINGAARAFSVLCGEACRVERAADPLNCGWIDAELLGDLPHARAARLTQRGPYGVLGGLRDCRAAELRSLNAKQQKRLEISAISLSSTELKSVGFFRTERKRSM